MTKHTPTPAPWRVKASNEYQGCFFVVQSNAWSDEEESKSNVRLIAKGPEMYELLSEIDGSYVLTNDLWDRIRAVLAEIRDTT